MGNRNRLRFAAAALTVAMMTSGAEAATVVYSEVAGQPRVNGTVRSQASNSGTYSYNESCSTGICAGTGDFSNKTYGDVSTGKLGAATFSTNRHGGNVSGAYSQWSEEVQFDFAGGTASREISFSFLVDGSVAPDPALTSGFNYGVYAFQIQAFAARDPMFGNLVNILGAVSASGFIFNPTTVGYEFGGTGCASSVAIVPGCGGSTIGKLTSLSAAGVTGSFLAKEGEFYRITAGLGAHGSADFFNTGTFRFASLGAGTTTQSASGVFLSNVGAVPEPSTWAMLIVGFGAVGTGMRMSRRRRVALAAA